jgi:hypothetical protein
MNVVGVPGINRHRQRAVADIPGGERLGFAQFGPGGVDRMILEHSHKRCSDMFQKLSQFTVKPRFFSCKKRYMIHGNALVMHERGQADDVERL